MIIFFYYFYFTLVFMNHYGSQTISYINYVLRANRLDLNGKEISRLHRTFTTTRRVSSCDMPRYDPLYGMGQGLGKSEANRRKVKIVCNEKSPFEGNVIEGGFSLRK